MHGAREARERPRSGAAPEDAFAPAPGPDACPTARPIASPNPGVAPLAADTLASALPPAAGAFTRGKLERFEAKLDTGRDAMVRTYYSGDKTNVRVDLTDMVGQCRLEANVGKRMFERELKQASTVGTELDQPYLQGLRFLEQDGAEGRVFTTFLADRCRLVFTQEFGEGATRTRAMIEAFDLSKIIERCASR